MTPSPSQYIKSQVEDRQAPLKKLRNLINTHLPKGFEEQMCYGMLGWVVPHSIYPKGYHVDPKQALPFINLASQKSHVGLYHMGIYAKPELLEWFKTEYPNHATYKLNMGKSCIRFKRMDDIPYPLIKSLLKKMTVEEWIQLYESHRLKK